MGQYYRPVIVDGIDILIYNRNVNGEYGMAKLMEHSWYDNPTVGKVCGAIYQHPCRIAWVGDYFEGTPPNIPIPGSVIWEVEGIEIKSPVVSIKDKILVNHDKREFIDCNYYKKEAIGKDGWCTHPLPILTACGNGQGGGDYSGTDMDNVGYWAGDLISLEDGNWKVLSNYEPLDCCFKM